MDKREYRRAETQATSMLRRAQGEIGLNSLEAITASRMLSDSLDAQGRANESLELRRQVVEIHKRLFGSSALETPLLLGELGRTYRLLNMHASALASLEQALEASKLHGNKNDLEAQILILWNLGSTHYALSNIDQAIATKIEAIRLVKERGGPTDPQLADAFLEIANISSETARFHETISYASQALSVLEAHSNSSILSRAEAISLIAGAHAWRGELKLALERFKSAMSLLDSHNLTNTAEMVKAQNGMAEVYLSLNRPDLAEELNRSALSILERSNGKQHYSYAIGLTHLASTLRQRERYRESLELELAALPVIKQGIGESSLIYAELLNNLGVTYLRLSDYKSAERLLGEAAQLVERQHGPLHPILAVTMHNYAKSLSDPARSEQALSLHLRALRNR
jgi:tetratricopeptide (TPR) repeat protein